MKTKIFFLLISIMPRLLLVFLLCIVALGWWIGPDETMASSVPFEQNFPHALLSRSTLMSYTGENERIFPVEIEPTENSISVYKDIVTPDGRIVPVSPPIKPDKPFITLNGNELGPVNVTVSLTLLSKIGYTMGGIGVQAYSEDWHIILPERWQKNYVDDSGKTSLMLPQGSWSFFASGFGYYTLLSTQSILTNTEIVIQPAATTTIEVRDFNGNGLRNVEVYLVETNHKPFLIPSWVGVTDQQGRLSVDVAPGFQYDVILLRPVLEDGTAFFVHAGTMIGGSNFHYQMRSDQLALVSFNLINSLGVPGPYSTWEVRYPHVSLDFRAWFQRTPDFWWDQLRLWVSPEPLIATAYEQVNDWTFSFSNDAFVPHAGQSNMIIFGGDLQIQTWFYPLLEPGQQMWIQVRDSMGHTLVLRLPSSGSSQIPIRLRNSKGNIVYEGVLDHPNLTGWLPLNPTGLRYEVNLDLGFFGTYLLEGIAMDASSTWPLEAVDTEHFRIFMPTQMNSISQSLRNMLEQLYATTSIELGHTTHSSHSHGKIEVHFPFYCNCAGWAGGSTFATMIEYLTYGDALWPYDRGAFKGVTSHELAHVFQGTGVDLSDYYVDGWFGEYFASFTGAMSLEDIYGNGIGFHWAILDLQGTSYWLSGVDPSVAYILHAIRKFYTMQAHWEWIRFWAGSSLPNRSLLNNLNMTDAEAIAVGYSYVAGENLGKLFREASFPISDLRIQEGLNAVSAWSHKVFLPSILRK